MGSGKTQILIKMETKPFKNLFYNETGPQLAGISNQSRSKVTNRNLKKEKKNLTKATEVGTPFKVIPNHSVPG